MFRKTVLGALVALVFVMGSTAWSQVAVVPGAYPPPPYYGYPWAYGGGYDYGPGSTPAGSYLAGMGQVIRASGQYNLLSSEAAINLEEAAKRDMENQLQWTNTYYEMRKIADAYRQASFAPQPPPGTWARLAQQEAPKRLAPGGLDPVTGRINWPSFLVDEPQFKQERDQLDQLFAERATMRGAIGYERYNAIRATVESMQAKLKDLIREVDTRTYLDSRTFLTGLAREADFPAHAPPPPSPGTG